MITTLLLSSDSLTTPKGKKPRKRKPREREQHSRSASLPVVLVVGLIVIAYLAFTAIFGEKLSVKGFEFTTKSYSVKADSIERNTTGVSFKRSSP